MGRVGRRVGVHRGDDGGLEGKEGEGRRRAVL